LILPVNYFNHKHSTSTKGKYKNGHHLTNLQPQQNKQRFNYVISPLLRLQKGVMSNLERKDNEYFS